MTSTTKLSPEALADLEVPEDIHISPSGLQVVYALSPYTRRGDQKQKTSSLWIADVGKEYSARQLTSGLFTDASPRWAPDSKSVAFISDRAKPGESSAIYLLTLGEGEPCPLTKSENEKSIESFAWSPDGKFIAFISPDEKTSEQKARERDKDDAKVYGENWEYNRLRCIHVATKELSILYQSERHVTDFAWNANSSEIAFISQATPELESPYSGVYFQKVSLSDRVTQALCKFPGAVESLQWLRGSLYFLAGYSPTMTNTSSTVYKLSIEDKTWSRDKSGEKSCALDLRTVGNDIAALVSYGLRDQIHLFDSDTLVHNEPYDISSWDYAYTPDKTSVLALAKSTNFEPVEVFTIMNGDTTQLSRHGAAIASIPIATIKPFYASAKDNTRLDSVLLLPSEPASPKPYPTAVIVHGGPYSRVSPTFDLPGFQWPHYLASAGYCVLLPNYRGGSSHGEKYAANASGGMGKDDFEDIITLLEAAVREGIVDRDRTVIGGWSQGGFHSYLAATRPYRWAFKGAICGAGVSDWDMMSMSSDASFWEAELAGKAPWVVVMADDTIARRGSPIWHMGPLMKTPVLILHGEEDERVPLSQAVAFRRGCKYWGVECEMVVYPRLGHGFEGPERGQMIDMLKRVRRFCDIKLK